MSKRQWPNNMLILKFVICFCENWFWNAHSYLGFHTIAYLLTGMFWIRPRKKYAYGFSTCLYLNSDFTELRPNKICIRKILQIEHLTSYIRHIKSCNGFIHVQYCVSTCSCLQLFWCADHPTGPCRLTANVTIHAVPYVDSRQFPVVCPHVMFTKLHYSGWWALK